MSDKDLNILKMLLYPRVFEIVLKIMQQKGIVSDFNGSNLLVYQIMVVWIIYHLTFEP